MQSLQVSHNSTELPCFQSEQLRRVGSAGEASPRALPTSCAAAATGTSSLFDGISAEEEVLQAPSTAALPSQNIFYFLRIAAYSQPLIDCVLQASSWRNGALMGGSTPPRKRSRNCWIFFISTLLLPHRYYPIQCRLPLPALPIISHLQTLCQVT